MEDLGLEKDAIDKILDNNSADIGKAKKAGDSAAARVAELEGELAEVGEKLKSYDGVDVAEKDAMIATLKADLEAQKAESAQKLADRDFSDLLHSEITAAKGLNPKAVMALLDVETLKASKNQKEDAAAAIKALAESDAYLFEASDGDKNKTPAKVNTGGEHTENSGSDDPFVAGAMKGAGLNTGKDE